MLGRNARSTGGRLRRTSGLRLFSAQLRAHCFVTFEGHRGRHLPNQGSLDGKSPPLRPRSLRLVFRAVTGAHSSRNVVLTFFLFFTASSTADLPKFGWIVHPASRHHFCLVSVSVLSLWSLHLMAVLPGPYAARLSHVSCSHSLDERKRLAGAPGPKAGVVTDSYSIAQLYGQVDTAIYSFFTKLNTTARTCGIRKLESQRRAYIIIKVYKFVKCVNFRFFKNPIPLSFDRPIITRHPGCTRLNLHRSCY